MYYGNNSRGLAQRGGHPTLTIIDSRVYVTTRLSDNYIMFTYLLGFRVVLWTQGGECTLESRVYKVLLPMY